MKSFILILFTCIYLAGLVLLANAEEEPQENIDLAAETKLIPLGNITLLGSYSKVCGGNNLSGIYASGSFAPVVKTDSQNYLIPLYSGLYTKQRQIINEEEGGRLYTTLMSHNFSLMHKHLYSDLITQRLTGFISLNYNKETSDESFGNGLYDYRDYGLNFDYQYNLLNTRNTQGVFLAGAKYYFRKYPNFKTVLSLASRTAPEEDEKDQNVWGPILRYTHNFTDKLTFSVGYEFLLKQFIDKHTIDPDGVLEDKEREDQVHYLELNSSYRLNDNLILGLDAKAELNNSNQNYYDTMDTPLVLGDDIFTPHYFNYNSYEISPSLTWLYSLSQDKKIIFKLAYAYTERGYNNRNIKDSAGTYQAEIQEDQIRAGYLNINFPLTQKLSFLINADYIHNTSNMEYERYYHYDYDIYHILSGFSYRF